MDNSNNTVAIKPSYDARLIYYDNLRIYMDNLAHAFNSRDLSSQLINLNGIYMLSSPYIKQKYKDELEELFDKIENLMKVNNQLVKEQVQKNIQQLSRKLFDYSKHLMLPQGMDDSAEEVDWEKFIQ
jgi:hypothetical protein